MGEIFSVYYHIFYGLTQGGFHGKGSLKVHLGNIFGLVTSIERCVLVPHTRITGSREGHKVRRSVGFDGLLEE